ncbi:hypothetical protein [Thalassovita sp.]|uniref:HORMA-1 domain-containing protein n=1 Tax=Thalassovita sp. TaxID=1979401 RepID=UPI002AAFED93|nr:hypothetical protein [Thalassovita sp.]
MSSSYTVSTTSSFTITHAKKIASKLAADLMRMHRLYGYPARTAIPEYEDEIARLLQAGYLESVKYGFQRDGKWIEPTLEYKSSDVFGLNFDDDDPGRVPRNKDVSNAKFHSFLNYNSNWWKLGTDERSSFEGGLPFQRTSGEDVGYSGYFDSDKSYTAGGRSLSRSTLRNF